jgi:hypothetical protein
MFLATLEGTKPELTTANMNDIFLLCEEFEFAALLSQVSDFRRQHAVIDDEARKSVSRVEEQNQRQRRALCLLQKEMADVREGHSREIAALSAQFAPYIDTLKGQFTGDMANLRNEQAGHAKEEEAMKREIAALGTRLGEEAAARGKLA